MLVSNTGNRNTSADENTVPRTQNPLKHTVWVLWTGSRPAPG